MRRLLQRGHRHDGQHRIRAQLRFTSHMRPGFQRHALRVVVAVVVDGPPEDARARQFPPLRRRAIGHGRNRERLLSGQQASPAEHVPAQEQAPGRVRVVHDRERAAHSRQRPCDLGRVAAALPQHIPEEGRVALAARHGVVVEQFAVEREQVAIVADGGLRRGNPAAHMQDRRRQPQRRRRDGRHAAVVRPAPLQPLQRHVAVAAPDAAHAPRTRLQSTSGAILAEAGPCNARPTGEQLRRCSCSCSRVAHRRGSMTQRPTQVLARRHAHVVGPRRPLSEFFRRPSVSVAVRILMCDTVDPDTRWSVFTVVAGSRLGPRAPFFQRALQFCHRCMPAKAPDVLHAAVRHGIAVHENDTLFCTFLGACRATTPPPLQPAFDAYRRCGPRTHNVISSLVSICRLANRPERALALVADAVDNDVDISQHLLSLFAVCCATSQTPHAADTAERILDLVRSSRIAPHPNYPTYANLVKALLCQARFDAAVGALDLLDSVGLPPCQHLYGLVVGALVHAEHMDKAMSVFRRVAERRVRLLAHVFTSLVAACGRYQYRGHTRALYRYATDHGYLDDVFIVDAFIAAFRRCGCIVDARQLFCSLTLPQTSTRKAMVAAYNHHDLYRDAIATFNDCRRVGHLLPGNVYSCIVEVFASRDRVRDALAVFREMAEHDVECSAPAFTCLVLTCGRNSHQFALQALHRFALSRDSDTLLSGASVAFVAAYIRCGRPQDALRVLSSMSSADLIVKAVALVEQLKTAGQLPADMADRLISSAGRRRCGTLPVSPSLSRDGLAERSPTVE